MCQLGKQWEEDSMAEEGQVGGGGSLESLPGMGPIRARALRKAGWDSIASLKKATVAELAAVPGITEQKARDILAQAASSTSTPTESPPKRRRPAARATSTTRRAQSTRWK